MSQMGSGIGASAAGGLSAGAGMFASLVSAYIEPTDPPGPMIKFAFNPAEYADSIKVNWKPYRQPATNGGKPQYLGVDPAKITVDILLDAFSVPPSVPTATIMQLKMLTVPVPGSGDTGVPSPAIVTFGWGTNIVMAQAYITALTVKYQRFLMGEPVRATATVTLQSVPPPSPFPPTNPSSGGLARRRSHTVLEGDTLASIAYKAYKNPNRWRALAIVNGIDDPMRLKAGTVLDVPDRRTAEALS
jgi:nucleoid-associated protein YgaU